MRKLSLLIAWILIFLTSCTSTRSSAPLESINNYYLCIVDTVITLYKFDNGALPLVTIPVNRQIIVKDRNQPYREVIYGEYVGYIKYRRFYVENAFDAKKLPGYVYNNDHTYTYVESVAKAANKSSRTNATSSSSSGGPVRVKGYYRKNGTYVRPHTRSAPTRRH